MITSPDGTSVAVYESGQPDGSIVLAVHGFPDNHCVWDGVAAILGERYRVLRYDVRGAGQSGRPTGRDGYQMRYLVDDLIAVLDAAGANRVHLLGHDWGSIQCWAALEDPRLDGRIASFTSISGPSLAHAAAWVGDARAHLIATARQLATSYYTLVFQVPWLPEVAARTGLFDRIAALASSRSRSAEALAAVPARSTADWVNGLQLYRANRLKTTRRPRPIAIPVQVLIPQRDAYIRPDFAAQAPVPFVENLRTRALAGGHWVICERPDVIARCVGEFVEHVERGAPMPDRPLVVVTGGARGIGRATALEFARHGSDVVIADVNDVAAKDTVAELAALGVRAASYHLDVADTAAWERFARQVNAEHGVPDVVVNNAGIGMGGRFLLTRVEDWERIIGVNVWGVIHGSRLFGRLMLDRGCGGQIVNIASAAAFSPSIAFPAYATTKAAVLMLTECLRAEFDREGIGVTAICPGFVDSDISTSTIYVGTDERTQEQLRARAGAAYRRRNYTPDRLAKHIVRAARRNEPIAVLGAEARISRAIRRFAPALGRRVAKVDLTKLTPHAR